MASMMLPCQITAHRGSLPALSSCPTIRNSPSLPARPFSPEIKRRSSSAVVCRAEQQTSSPSAPVGARIVGAAALAVLLLASPDTAMAGILSDSPVSEKKRYEDFDATFKASPLLQGLLQKSKENKEMNDATIANKYCARGAEWGVGDCSLEGLRPEDKAAFMGALKEAQDENADQLRKSKDVLADD